MKLAVDLFLRPGQILLKPLRFFGQKHLQNDDRD